MKKLISLLMMVSAVSLLMASEKVFQHEEFSAYDVQNIKVKASSGNVKVVSDSSSKIIVETYSSRLKVVDVKIKMSGGTLFIYATGWSFFKQQPNIRIFLPKNFSFDNLELKLSSGNVDIDSVECSEINITLTSGDLDMNNSSIAGDIKIKSTSGNIGVDDVVCENFKAGLTSGDIDVENLTCTEFDADTTSGKIKCDGLSCETAQVETTSGDLDINNSSIAGDIKIKSTSGDIEIELLEMPCKKISLKAISGFVTLILPKNNDGYSATVNTGSGTFKDEFTGMKANNCTGATSVYESGGTEIELSTKSGGIKIEKADRK